MERIDHDLAFMLRFENVAWFENGKVKILDRRIYPMEVKYVECETHEEVVKAIQDMVTQSGGPYLAATMGMVLAAYETKVKNLNNSETKEFMKKAADKIANARPTTSSRMRKIVDNALSTISESDWENKDDLIGKFREFAISEVSNRYKNIEKMGDIIAEKVPNNGTIMTQCFAETVVGMICRKLKEKGKDTVKFITPETRPYLQGARLTASVIKDMGFDVHVITDNMPGYILKNKKVDLFTSASDMITKDGHVINKVGTFQIAVLCHYHGIPYFVTGNPSEVHESIDDIIIEERDENDVLSHLGKKVTLEGVKAYYPAFDITPPHLVSGVVTNKGMYSPYNLSEYFKD
ncbi:s-methyl-5-thioribose-1-phosphate isomerase [Helcococcus kunzii]|uniref:s-methyl-5-thioribose-1-phosphate isomerase n=1 Tax=Helcococcus kunzii TaxID=40091 RepID=UPI001C95EF37|nr:s-methyl-5-thioribose-1-phosphate isomerase [Helcococcus kunzii]QZO76853.1 s-methyl-5-thioribose-1-phosphate isomerase [Helcococcus kunzii]